MHIFYAINEYICNGIVIHPLSMPDNNQKSCKGKVPVLNNWAQLTEPINLERFVTQWPAGPYQDFFNVGMVAGNKLPDGSYLSAIDINVYDESKEEIFQDLVRAFHIERPVWQETSSQGLHLFIRTDRSLSSTSVMIGDEGSKKIVNLLSRSRSVVLAPSIAMGQDDIEREYIMHGSLWEAPIVSSDLVEQYFDSKINANEEADDLQAKMKRYRSERKQFTETFLQLKKEYFSQQTITTNSTSRISPTHQNVIC